MVAPPGQASAGQRPQFAQAFAKNRLGSGAARHHCYCWVRGPWCLLQTALDLLEDEFDVWVVTDACSSRSERNRDAAFDRLAGAGVELVTIEMVAFEWLRSAEHPAFKEIQALIK